MMIVEALCYLLIFLGMTLAVASFIQELAGNPYRSLRVGALVCLGVIGVIGFSIEMWYPIQ